jgi:prepilin-type N-terminal cleavage/methylation domain-containing protein
MKARQRRGDDAGFSLPELLVVMLLSSIVLAAVAVVFNGSMRVARAASAKGNTTGDARIAIDAMLRRLRVAVVPPGGTSPFGMAGTATGTNYPTGVGAVPSATEVAFFASLTTAGSTADPAPTLVDYSIDAGAKCLREKMTPASGTAPSFTWPLASTRSRCLIFGVINTDGSRLFSYFPDGKTATALTISLAADNAKSIDSVGIDLAVTGTTTTDVLPTKESGRVTLTNVAGDDLVPVS